MRLLWKRFFLMIVGAWLVLSSVTIWSGPLQPVNDRERAIFFMSSVAMLALGIWMLIRGFRLRPPSDPPPN